MRFRNLRPVLLCVTLAVTCASDAAAEKWRKVVTPQFTLYSSAKGAETLRMATEFQQFIGALGEEVRIDSRMLPPLTIVVFDRKKEFLPFRPLRPNGQPWDVAGFFSRQDGWSVFGLAGARMTEELRRTVFHEGVHWYLSGDDRANPPWLEEGLAEVFSTFEVERGKCRWGRAIPEHVLEIHALGPMPLERLLSVLRTDPLFNESERTGLFYAESWAFVHYLLFGADHHQGRIVFNQYLRSVHVGMHPDESFKVVFGKDYKGMDRELSDYLDGGQFYVRTIPVTAAANELKIEAAENLELEVALGRLALGANNPALAQGHADAALTLDPNSAAANELAGYAAAARGDQDGMARHFAVAARNGSKDYRVYFEAAQRGHLEGAGLGGMLGLSAKTARSIATDYERTINLRPRFLPAYQGLGGIVELLGSNNAEDRRFLEQGHTLYPADGMILLGLAASAHVAGNRDEARRLLAEVVSAPQKHPSHVNTYAERLDEGWAFEDAGVKIDALAKEGRFEEAVAGIDALLAKGVSPLRKTMLVSNRANLEASAKMKQAQAAWNERRWSDARKLLESVVASPVQPTMKSEARRRLADLDRRNPDRN